MHGIYTNIQGLLNNFNQLEIMSEEEKPDFIILSETHLTEAVNESEIELKHYQQYSTLSNSNKTGGVTIYFKKIWNITKIKEYVKETKYWISVHKVKYEKT